MARLTVGQRAVTMVEALRMAREEGATYRGIWSWITTVDHKRIGVLYGVTAFAFFLVGGIEAMAMRLQLARPENTLVSPELYHQLLTLHALRIGVRMIKQRNAACSNVIIPQQIGAR